MIALPQLSAIMPRIALAFVLVCALPLTAVQAQDNEPVGEATLPDTAHVRRTLATLDAQVQAEAVLVEEARASVRQRRAAAQEERQRLAAALVARAMEAERLKRQLRDVESSASDALKHHEALVQRRSEVEQSLRLTRDQLLVLLAEQPGAIVAQRSKQLSSIPSTGDVPDLAAQVARLNTTLADISHDMRRIHVTHTQVCLADGALSDVKLLALGATAWVCESLDGTRQAMALASPADASGIRWLEDLPEHLRLGIRDAISALESGAATLAFPIDVTGTLRVDGFPQEQGLLPWFHAGGPVMYALALVALLAVSLVIERTLVLYLLNRPRTMTWRSMRQALSDGDFANAREILGNTRDAVSATLRACMNAAAKGKSAMEEAIEIELLQQMPRLRRSLSGLAVLAAVAPLLGLLGTVTGIIETFSVLHSSGAGNPGLMADGISEALITTEAGLIVAIPVLLLRGLLRGRMESILSEAERQAASLLSGVSSLHVARAQDKPSSQLDADLRAYAAASAGEASSP